MATTKKYVSLEKLGLYDEKIKKVISDGDSATLDAAKAYSDSKDTQFDIAGAAATAESKAKSYTDTEIAKVNEAVATAQAQADKGVADAAIADGKAVAAQEDVDALSEYVGTIPDTAEATNIVAYVQEKTAGIATDAALEELTGRVAQTETDIDNIEKDYLKAADKTELEGKITAAQTAVDTEKSRAEGIEAGLRTDVDVIKGDYLKTADKTELQGNIDTVNAAVERLTNGVSAEEVDGVNDLIQYVKDHGTEVTGMQEDISENADAIAGVAGRMDTAEGKIATLEGAVATKAEQSAFDEAVETLEGADDVIKGRLDILEAAIGESGSVATDIEEAVNAEAERVDGLLEGKVDKVEGKGLSTNDLTNELKANYDAAYAHSQEAHAPANAQENVIETVKVNGTALTVTGKAVDIAVPTDNAELTNGAGYLVAADIANKADKATTLAGYGIADAYTSAQTDTAIANAVGQFVECSEEEINALFTTTA